MKEEKKKQLEELFTAGKWTEFLGALPTNNGDTFKFQTTGQIMTLKVMAARLSNKEGAKRQYSVRGVNYENLTAFIEATTKKDGNAQSL